jgi:hypothetical protein
MKFYIFLILLGVVLGIGFAITGWPIWIAYIVIVVVGVTHLLSPLYVLYRSKNLEALTKIVDKFKKNPIYLYMYLLRDGTNEELLGVLDQVLTKYKNEKYQAIYGTLHALLQEDFQAARQYIKPMLHKEVGQYTNDLIDILEGNYDDIPTKSYEKDWMNSSIVAHKAYMEKDIEGFEIASRQAVQQAVGIQHYGNYYTFQRMHKELQQKFNK